MNLSPDQAAAYDRLREFVTAPRVARPYITMFGYAGSGKSTILAALAREYPSMMLTAFTGKAASVLRRKVDLPVSTVHSAIYRFTGLDEDDQPTFHPKGDRLPDRMIAIDECGFINTIIARDVLATGARVLACGDPGQLPPVSGSPFFTEADVTLTEIHRQALNSAVLRQAHQVRTAGRYEADGNDFRVVARAAPEDLLAADMLLCWRNRTRVRLNAKKRLLLGRSGFLRAGEPIMCLRNDHRVGVLNGAVYPLLADATSRMVYVDGERGPVRVEPAIVEGDPSFERYRNDDDYTPFAPGYAATVHKAAGSEWNNVLVIDEGAEDWQRHMYTAITRAAERCVVVDAR